MSPSEKALHDRAREILACEWELAGRPSLAETIRKGRDSEWSKSGPAVRAIAKALRENADVQP